MLNFGDKIFNISIINEKKERSASTPSVFFVEQKILKERTMWNIVTLMKCNCNNFTIKTDKMQVLTCLC